MIWMLLVLALQVSPELVEHVNAGLKAKQAGNLKLAAMEFEKVVGMAPGLAAAHVNLGAVYLDQKDYARATPALRKALEIDGSMRGAHGMLGVSLLAQGYAGEAIPHLEKGAMEDVLGVALLEVGREREAIDKLEAALVKQPGNEDLIYYLGQAHGRLARDMGERLTRQAGESARALQLMGEAHAAGGNREAAVKAFQRALDLRPELQGVHLALGELHQGAGDLEAAEKEYGVEAKQWPGSALAAYRWGSVLFTRGDLAGGLRELERADVLKPGMPETLLELGRARAANGATQAAENALLQVVNAESEGRLAESAHFQLSQLYRKMNRTAEAEKHLARFRELKKKQQP